jgi:hypothetical protein
VVIFFRPRSAVLRNLFAAAFVMIFVLPSLANAQNLKANEVLFCETSSNLLIHDGVAETQANIKFAINLRGDIMRMDLNSQLINWLEGRDAWDGANWVTCLMDKDRDRKQKCPLGEDRTTEVSVYRPDLTIGNVPVKAGFKFSGAMEEASLIIELNGETGNFTMVNVKQMRGASLVKTAFGNCVGVEEF